MTKSRHEKLAHSMKAMLIMIENHENEVYKILNHARLIVSKKLSSHISKNKLIILLYKKPTEMKSEKLNPENNKLKILLYCPNKSEPHHEIDWSERENEQDSISYQLRSIHEYYRREEIIKTNLLKAPNPVYEKSKQIWQNPSTETNDLIATEAANLNKNSFAPTNNESIALAYERVLKSTHEKKDRHREGLRRIYKNELENAIFEGVPIERSGRKSFIEEWKINLFGRKTNHSKNISGRYEQSQAIDSYTAGKIILYLIHEFISSPTIKKASGEAACFLWILVRAAKESADLKIKLTEVAKLRISQINKENPEIDFGNERVLEISSGLHCLLLCLSGKIKEDIRLFENIDEDMKNLQRKFTKICKELNINPPIMPSSFILPPHLYPGVRISSAEVEARKKATPLIPTSAAKTRKKIKDWLKSIGEQIKKTSSSPC